MERKLEAPAPHDILSLINTCFMFINSEHCASDHIVYSTYALIVLLRNACVHHVHGGMLNSKYFNLLAVYVVILVGE